MQAKWGPPWTQRSRLACVTRCPRVAECVSAPLLQHVGTMRVPASLRRPSASRARQIGGSLGASVVIQLSLLASGILTARSLGPTGRGDLAILFILPSVALQLACVGVPSAVTYYVARQKGAAGTIAKSLVPVAGVQLLVSAALLLLLSGLFLEASGGTRTAALLTVAAMPLFLAQFYGLHLLQGLNEIRLFNIFRAAGPVALSIGLACGLVVGLTVLSCTAIWLTAVALTTVAMSFVVPRRIRHAKKTSGDLSAPPRPKEIVRFAAAGFLAQISPVETFRVDTLVVAALFPSSVVGYYAVALSLSNAPRFIADALVAVASPQIAAQDAASGRAAALRYIIAAALACGATAGVLALAAPYLVPFLFGSAFDAAVGLSVILVAAAACVSVKRVGIDCLRALGRPGATTVIEVATLLVMGTGFVLLGSQGEGTGVAVALLLSALGGLLLTLYAVNATTGRPPDAGPRAVKRG